MEAKRLKDPVYGYIEVDGDLIVDVIDTAVFQRLRDVIQTSYEPLYPSAVHNRFVHSLGVYYLGKIAAETFLDSFRGTSPSDLTSIEQYAKIFKLACLLHDVGHAPFSHTGEMFYLEKGERIGLHRQILELTGDDALEKEIRDNSYKAAPHELMSVIVSLRTYDDIIPHEKKSFFARCITGYKYTAHLDEEKSIKNCLIELLNSKIIDVDKLDYLLRDSYMTGFDTTAIDYMRLLRSIRPVKDEKGYYRVCYDKAAVSVIENVVYAHDSERKWIQNHPVILYDAFLGENAINQVMRQILKSESLSYALLTEEGVEIDNYGKIRLMGDSDIRFLIKNLVPDCKYMKEYYDRNARMHPLWKTEEEFQAIFLGYEKQLAVIEDEFDSLRDFLRTLGLPLLINSVVLWICKAEIKKMKAYAQKASGRQQERQREALETKGRHLKWMELLESFAGQADIEFNFLVLYVDQFNSGFRKPEFGKIELVFPELRHPCKFSEISTILTPKKSRGEKFFYLYYAKKEPGQKVKINKLIKSMLEFANGILLERSDKEIWS